jgi:hypothetical protein
MQIERDDDLTLNMLEAGTHDKEASTGGEEVNSVDLTFAMFLACIVEESNVAASLLIDVSLPTFDDTQKSRKQEPRSHVWLEAYSRLTVCSCPLQNWLHNMLASDVQSIMDVPSLDFVTKLSLILKRLTRLSSHRANLNLMPRHFLSKLLLLLLLLLQLASNLTQLVESSFSAMDHLCYHVCRLSFGSILLRKLLILGARLVQSSKLCFCGRISTPWCSCGDVSERIVFTCVAVGSMYGLCQCVHFD